MILSTHMKSQMQQCVPITLVLDSGEEEEMDAWNSLASQPSKVSGLQLHRETLSHREKDSTGICTHSYLQVRLSCTHKILYTNLKAEKWSTNI